MLSEFYTVLTCVYMYCEYVSNYVVSFILYSLAYICSVYVCVCGCARVVACVCLLFGYVVTTFRHFCQVYEGKLWHRKRTSFYFFFKCTGIIKQCSVISAIIISEILWLFSLLVPRPKVFSTWQRFLLQIRKQF